MFSLSLALVSNVALRIFLVYTVEKNLGSLQKMIKTAAKKKI